MPKKVFISPLDWGLGHATRCVPVIKEILKAGHEVILGITPLTATILKEEFPDLKTVDVPECNIQYSSKLPVWATIILDYPRLKKLVNTEQDWIKQFVEEYAPDVIISDSRYGFYSENAKNIFITHQLWIKAPFFETRANMINHSFLKNFQEIWVPDFENEKINLSGELAHGLKPNINIKYIQPLSRLALKADQAIHSYEVLFLLSGPEPKRTQLESEILNYVNTEPGNFCIVRGTKITSPDLNRKGLKVIDMPAKNELEELISASRSVLCRSGYSSLMDLYSLNKNIFIIPTPGQTEQEYLADHLNGKFGFKKINKVHDMKEFSLGYNLGNYNSEETGNFFKAIASL
ncbi:MAG: hypothetical protein IAF38_02840 [Bacteroidia bacterium]|nr:hypothetical protein [Bacteroidia bacterium]